MTAESHESNLRVTVIDATICGSLSYELDDAIRREYLGGSYLGTYLWLESSRLEVNPLSAANALVVAPGLLTGFPVITANRASFVAKSPLTGLLSESTVGGFFGAKLKATGTEALVVKGAFETPSYIILDGNSGRAEIREAGVLWGKDVFETFEILQELHGKDLDAAVIGPAGENGVFFAGVVVGGVDSRAVGRTGMGAVMGSKNLKAIVVRGGKNPRPADPKDLARAMHDLTARVKERAIPWGQYGTAGGVISSEATGDLPIQNWKGGSFPGAAKITGQAMTEKGIVTGHYSCWGCPIHCGKDVRLEIGDRAGQKSHGPEYETIGAFGSLCLIEDPNYITAANDLANRLGLDTITAGNAVAFAIEAYERGIIDDSIAGRPLRWGDGEVLLFLLDEIAHKRGLGAILAKGVRQAAEELGPLAKEFAVHVKGLEIPLHDPRAYTSMAANYATSNRGACHLEGLTYYVESGNYKKDLINIEADTTNLNSRGKAEIASKMQDFMTVFNTLGICKFILRAQVSPGEMAGWVNSCLGWSITEQDLLAAGERTFNLRRLCNVALGVTRKDDTLPPRLVSQPRPSGRAKDVIPFVGEMLNEYYAMRGWDPEGLPKLTTLERLKLSDYPENLGIKKQVLTK